MTDIGAPRLHIPVGTVPASPYCRTIDTAKLAFGKVTIEPELEHTVTATEALTRQRAAALSAVGQVPRAAPTPC
jgi:hypothetical protein